MVTKYFAVAEDKEVIWRDVLEGLGISSENFDIDIKLSYYNHYINNIVRVQLKYSNSQWTLIDNEGCISDFLTLFSPISSNAIHAFWIEDDTKAIVDAECICSSLYLAAHGHEQDCPYPRRKR